MFCKEYRFMKWNEVDGVKIPVVWVELYADTTPNTFPTNASGIDNFPSCYDAENTVFAPGSVLVVVEDSSIYLANSDGEFVKFGE